MAIHLNRTYLKGFMADHELGALSGAVKAAHESLHNHTGLGNDFLGWVELPTNYDREEFSRIQKAAEKIRKQADILVVIGIGGSYLGARAAIELLRSPLYNNLKKDTPDIYFAGNSVSPSYLQELLSICEGKDIAVNVISKSGTTTEPALAFRVFKALLEKKYGAEGAKERIYCTTDKAKGTLKELADREGYATFVVPDDVGGRYSVLTAVGLLPIAAAGCDIQKLMDGAKAAQEAYNCSDLEKNECYQYAATRFALYQKGKSVEIMASFDPCFAMMAEWYKQLFGESEGKDGRGIFPAALELSADLHSMGQYMQQGERLMLETMLYAAPSRSAVIPAGGGDGLEHLSGRELAAHVSGGVPCIRLDMPPVTAASAGNLFYFFELSCALSAYVSGVFPFDQPGVEEYKTRMFALLGKT